MPVAAGTPLDPAATRAKVLAAAGKLFYARGVHAVGVAEIARVAGASKLSLYRYFGSKEGLVAAVLTARSDRIHGWLTATVGRAAHTTPRERVLAVFDALCQWYTEAGFRGCAIVNAATDTRGDPGDTPLIARTHLGRYQQLFETELTAMGAEDPVSLARQLLVLIEGATTIAAIERSPDAGRHARRAAQTLLTAADHQATPP